MPAEWNGIGTMTAVRKGPDSIDSEVSRWVTECTISGKFRAASSRINNAFRYLIEEEQFGVTLNLITHVEQFLHVVGERCVGLRRQGQGVVA